MKCHAVTTNTTVRLCALILVYNPVSMTETVIVSALKQTHSGYIMLTQSGHVADTTDN